jgi:hypothetical protein
MANDKAGPESIYRLTLAYAASVNAGAQRDRTAAYRERTEVQRLAIERRAETARIHAETARTRADAQLKRASNTPNHPHTSDDPEDPLAPYGRKENGDAYSEEEFNQSLDQAIKEIWGLPPVNPNSRMPEGWNRARDDESSISARNASEDPPSAQPTDPDSPRAPSPGKNPFVIRNSPFVIDRATLATSSNPKGTSPARYPSGDG